MGSDKIKKYCKARGLNEQELEKECVSHGTDIRKLIDCFQKYDREELARQRDEKKQEEKSLHILVTALVCLDLAILIMIITAIVNLLLKLQ